MDDKTKSIISSILYAENTKNEITEKVLDSLENNKPNHFYLNNTKILSLKEFNQTFTFVESNNLLIRENNKGLYILYFKNDNEMIDINLDYHNNHYRITYLSKEEERGFDIDKEKMIILKKNKTHNYNQTFMKKDYTIKDYENIKDLTSNFILSQELENEVLTYLKKYSPNLAEEIIEIITEINQNVINNIYSKKSKQKEQTLVC